MGRRDKVLFAVKERSVGHRVARTKINYVPAYPNQMPPDPSQRFELRNEALPKYIVQEYRRNNDQNSAEVRNSARLQFDLFVFR